MWSRTRSWSGGGGGGGGGGGLLLLLLLMLTHLENANPDAKMIANAYANAKTDTTVHAGGGA